MTRDLARKVYAIVEPMTREDCYQGLTVELIIPGFKKSSKSSQEFIELVKKNTLIVCADSGPLHIALALQKDLIALMRVTVPEIVINTGSCLRVDGF